MGQAMSGRDTIPTDVQARRPILRDPKTSTDGRPTVDRRTDQMTDADANDGDYNNDAIRPARRGERRLFNQRRDAVVEGRTTRGGSIIQPTSSLHAPLQLQPTWSAWVRGRATASASALTSSFLDRARAGGGRRDALVERATADAYGRLEREGYDWRRETR